jgi:hypothetical protein
MASLWKLQGKKNCLHTWWAILKGRYVLDLGLMRRTGDGSTTNIWSDRCIPDSSGGKPICKKVGAPATKVSEMLSMDGNAWNLQKPNDNLILPGVLAVQRILLAGQ